MSERVKTFFRDNPKLRKIVGSILIVVGFLALFVPFVPGALPLFIGLELLGFDLIFWHKIKQWWARKS